MPTHGIRHHVWIFLLSMALLMQEIAVARALSVALMSHYAFVAISLAMFGIGLSGLVVYLLPERFPASRLDALVGRFGLWFALAAPLSMLAFLNIHVTQELNMTGLFTLTAAYLILMVPFYIGGTAVSMLLTHRSDDISRIYFADLVGASLGCLATVLMLETLPAPAVPSVVGAVVAVLAVTLGWKERTNKVAAVGIAVAAVVIGFAGVSTDLFQMRYVKNWNHVYSEYEVWNSFSRISAFHMSEGIGIANVTPLKGSGKDYPAEDYPDTMMLDIDGSAWTPMMEFDGDLESVQFLRGSVLYLVHNLKKDANTLIVGTGGGRDLIAAKAFGQPRVLGIELNPLMEHVVQERYAEWSGRPYTMEGVEVILDEARSRLHQIEEHFDVIQLSLIDTFSLNAAGGFVFSENNLYTTEAFQQYFDHLTDDGILSLTRYYVDAYPLEVVKLLAMARQAWEAQGIADVAEHILVVRQGLNATALMKKSPFTATEVDKIEAIAADNGMQILYAPVREANNVSIDTVVTTPDLTAFTDSHEFVIEAPTDDRPFFFNFLRGRIEYVPQANQDPFRFLLQWDDALRLMRTVITVVSVLAALCFFGPLLLFARDGIASTQLNLTIPLLLYFGCLGYGFMMVEIPMMQQLVLLLGYPVYALAVVLFAILLFSGIGSLLTSRFENSPEKALPLSLGAIIVLGTLYRLYLPELTEIFLPYTTNIKILATVVILAPIGLALGTAFPLGIGILRRVNEGLVPWAWSVNGALSVVASVLAPFLGSKIGFSMAMNTGVAAYALALILILYVARRPELEGA
ncbi:MAG: hypothetical protein ACI8TX_000316 [Hyphomicrobiaceae bacterium]|jgi:hypothetical protein